MCPIAKQLKMERTVFFPVKVPLSARKWPMQKFSSICHGDELCKIVSNKQTAFTNFPYFSSISSAGYPCYCIAYIVHFCYLILNTSLVVMFQNMSYTTWRTD